MKRSCPAISSYSWPPSSVLILEAVRLAAACGPSAPRTIASSIAASSSRAPGKKRAIVA
jgi:hypothetical protein